MQKKFLQTLKHLGRTVLISTFLFLCYVTVESGVMPANGVMVLEIDSQLPIGAVSLSPRLHRDDPPTREVMTSPTVLPNVAVLGTFSVGYSYPGTKLQRDNTFARDYWEGSSEYRLILVGKGWRIDPDSGRSRFIRTLKFADDVLGVSPHSFRMRFQWSRGSDGISPQGCCLCCCTCGVSVCCGCTGTSSDKLAYLGQVDSSFEFSLDVPPTDSATQWIWGSRITQNHLKVRMWNEMGLSNKSIRKINWAHSNDPRPWCEKTRWFVGWCDADPVCCDWLL